jgi:sensor histidine kinase YesM
MFRIKTRYLYIFLLGTYSYLNIKFTEGDSLFEFTVPDYILFGLVLLFVLFIWEGNRLLANLIQRIPLKRTYGPLITHFAGSVLMVLILSAAMTLAVPSLLNFEATWVAFKLLLGFTFRVNLFLHCINAIIFYHNQLREVQLQSERFQKESAEARFISLRNQVNPHFLFNSLNVLSNLVYKDADTSNQFIEQLSEVYRYLLKNQEKKLVRLEEELAFIDSYIFLIKIRFQDNLIIERKFSDESLQDYVAPSSLQLLIENAIKHNEVSRQQPLTIRIFDESKYVVVENTIQLKTQEVESNHIGLENIRSRYEFLNQDDPVIVKQNGVFTVKIPLIKVEDDELNDY